MNQTEGTDISPFSLPCFFFFCPISGSEERAENNLQVSRCLWLLCRTDLLEAAVTFPRHWATAEVSIRHCSASAECHQCSDRRDGTRRAPSSWPEPPHYWSGLPRRLSQLLQAFPLLPGYRWPVMCQRHQLSESVLWTRLQHSHASHQPVLPLSGTLVLPRRVSDMCEGGGGIYLQSRINKCWDRRNIGSLWRPAKKKSSQLSQWKSVRETEFTTDVSWLNYNLLLTKGSHIRACLCRSPFWVTY